MGLQMTELGGGDHSAIPGITRGSARQPLKLGLLLSLVQKNSGRCTHTTKVQALAGCVLGRQIPLCTARMWIQRMRFGRLSFPRKHRERFGSRFVRAGGGGVMYRMRPMPFGWKYSPLVC